MQQDDTVNAAAVVLAAAARSTTGLHHHQQLDSHACSSARRTTRWWSRLKAKLMCFRPHGHSQRIADASPAASSSSCYYTRQAPQPALAFVAPPSSPASSVVTSESPSPAVLLNASSSYSSPATPSIFAIGPYAREPQQLVSPPAFSAGLTEPSTAPLTPPPESTCSLQPATTPSSPEVPFARFLSSSSSVAAEKRSGGTEGGFHAYQLQPGSPIGGALVSPGSTTSSSSPPSWKTEHRVRARIAVPEAARRMRSGSARVDEDEAHTHTRHGNEEVGKSGGGGGEFVFGSAEQAGEWFAGRGGAATASSMDMEAVQGSKQQWPFFLPHA